MKKVSKMPQQLPETIGIDLGDKVSRYAIVDPAGEVIEEGSFRNQVSSIEKHFGDRPRRVALEDPHAPKVMAVSMMPAAGITIFDSGERDVTMPFVVLCLNPDAFMDISFHG